MTRAPIINLPGLVSISASVDNTCSSIVAVAVTTLNYDLGA